MTATQKTQVTIPTTGYNHNAAAGSYHGLSQSDIANILTLYPDANNAA
ncbi:hypothetical protein [Serratia fonticola]|nr:hypothetical protein [Serratia fonticola]MBL5827017.1 hypothetical protein [Serratia fonticola]MBL5862619.1 hypothetical protein [Serratia fonticola]